MDVRHVFHIILSLSPKFLERHVYTLVKNSLTWTDPKLNSLTWTDPKLNSLT